MEKGIRVCKICDKEYPYCKTERPVGLYRWQDVACCPEHAAIYFEQIAISRGEKVPEKIEEEPKSVEEHEIEVEYGDAGESTEDEY